MDGELSILNEEKIEAVRSKVRLYANSEGPALVSRAPGKNRKNGSVYSKYFRKGLSGVMMTLVFVVRLFPYASRERRNS